MLYPCADARVGVAVGVADVNDTLATACPSCCPNVLLNPYAQMMLVAPPPLLTTCARETGVVHSTRYLRRIARTPSAACPVLHFRLNVNVVVPPACVRVAPASNPAEVTGLGSACAVLLRWMTPSAGSPTTGRQGYMAEQPNPIPTLHPPHPSTQHWLRHAITTIAPQANQIKSNKIKYNKSKNI